jgi:5-methyltetrahydrofolate--homocysteine methyltransferase
MVHVAKEMTRQGFTIPLLIGGATTSKVHTAVKIEPHYPSKVIHVNDASRSVPVVSNLLSEDLHEAYIASVCDEYERVRDYNKKEQSAKIFLSFEKAIENRLMLDWKNYHPVVPQRKDLIVLRNFPLDEIVPLIDWTPFFHSWEMKGSFPKILEDKEKGVEASKLFDDAQKMLKHIVQEKWLTANAVAQIFPANAVGEDLLIYENEKREKVLGKFYGLRQQTGKPEGTANVSLADFLAPVESGLKDFLGAFAVTTGIGLDEKVAQFEKQHDDYSAIMLKALADRLAEAFTELLHLKVRTDFWGYAKDEKLKPQQLLKEEFVGIRPAPGYPSQPDHTEKKFLFELLQAEKNAGIQLTESLAMVPTAAVCGIYFAHPEAKYFALGRIKQDQVADYALRKGISLEEAERWLSPVLAY